MNDGIDIVNQLTEIMCYLVGATFFSFSLAIQMYVNTIEMGYSNGSFSNKAKTIDNIVTLNARPRVNQVNATIKKSFL